MKISKPRRGILKQAIRGLIISKPKINNLELACELGIHRNTVTKLLEEIRNENEIATKKRWKLLLNDVTVIADKKITELNRLWIDSYRSNTYSRPSQLVTITKANWMILKDLYRLHLEYAGIRESPKSLIQVNISNKQQKCR